MLLGIRNAKLTKGGHKIKGFKNWSYQEISTVKVVLLIHHFYLENLNFVIFVIWNKVVNCFLRRTPFYMLYLVSYRTLVYLELIIPVQELGTFNTSFGVFFTSLSKSIIRDQKFGFIYRTLSSWILFTFVRVSPFNLSENDFRLRIVSIWLE